MWTYIRTCTLLAALLAVVLPAQAQQELPLGTSLPMADATVTLADNPQASLNSLLGEQGTVFLFWSNQCPWVEKYEDRVMALKEAFTDQGIAFVLVNSNDPNAFPQESAAESQKHAQRLGVPYILDPQAQLASAFGATRAPHVYVFDGNQTLTYVGSIDDSPGDPANVQKQYLRDALQAVVSGASLDVGKTKAFGCMIKTAGG